MTSLNNGTSEVARLFRQAEERGGYEYLYLLVRIDGIQCYDGYKDELVVLRDRLNQPHQTDSLIAYRSLTAFNEPLDLLKNLVNCANGRHYQVRPFLDLSKAGPGTTWPTLDQKVATLIEIARASGFPQLADQVGASYPQALLGTDQPPHAMVSAALTHLTDLLKQIVDCYFGERLKYKDEPKYHKLPRSLDVLELISDDEFGLSGLRVHFSQNCTAEFQRTPRGVFGKNLEFGPPVTFLMMSLGPTGSNEYRVNGKRLYEIGLPWRYNALGKWKPLVYPGKIDHLMKECVELSDDPDVQGALLYMLLTGHRCIEFVLCTNLEFPGEHTTSSPEGGVHLWKCPPPAGQTSNSDITIYDCWIDLESGTVEEIEHTLALIGRFVSIFCFPFGATYNWRTKYKVTNATTGVLTPTEADLSIVGEVIKSFPSTEHGEILETGIDWYNRASMSTNVFTSFFCYYVAFESVAVAIAEGVELGKTHIQKLTKAQKQLATINCINQKHLELFADDPKRFVVDSYFECVQGLTEKTRKAAAAVFGEQHRYLKLLFEKSENDGTSLSRLRSAIAHGDLSLLNKQHEHLLRKNLHSMEHITREFLLRVLFRLDPSETVPSWSGKFQITRKTADPRSILVMSDEKLFPTGADWTIRAEWCD
jgi:hypothetical protein